MNPARCAHCGTPFPSRAARDDHQSRCGANLDARTAARALVVNAVRELEEAALARDAAIVDAHRAGMTYREIGAAASMSHVGVLKVVQKAGAA